MVYWIKQLRIFDDAGTEDQDTTAPFFLKIRIKHLKILNKKKRIALKYIRL
jgi:hypothetical protein